MCTMPHLCLFIFSDLSPAGPIFFSDSHLVRKSPPAYSDGVYMLAGQNRPSPRKLSRLFMKGLDGLSSMTNRTALLAFFGQVVTSEVVMASESGCPIEMHHIEIEKCDEMYDEECRGDKYIPFHRAGYDRKTGQSPNSPREQVGEEKLLEVCIPPLVGVDENVKYVCSNLHISF